MRCCSENLPCPALSTSCTADIAKTSSYLELIRIVARAVKGRVSRLTFSPAFHFPTRYLSRMDAPRTNVYWELSLKAPNTCMSQSRSRCRFEWSRLWYYRTSAVTISRFSCLILSRLKTSLTMTCSKLRRSYYFKTSGPFFKPYESVLNNIAFKGMGFTTFLVTSTSKESSILYSEDSSLDRLFAGMRSSSSMTGTSGWNVAVAARSASPKNTFRSLWRFLLPIWLVLVVVKGSLLFNTLVAPKAKEIPCERGDRALLLILSVDVFLEAVWDISFLNSNLGYY